MTLIGRNGEELDLVKLGTLCQERNLHHREMIKAGINSNLHEIARNNFEEQEVARGRPYGVEHEGQALDVWEQILENITDSADISVLWEVCMMFRNILRRKYMETILPQVVKLIVERSPEYLLPDEIVNPLHVLWRTTEDFFRYNNAKVSCFTKFRLLSKHCKKSLESISRSRMGFLFLLRFTPRTTARVQGICETLRTNPSIAATFFPVNVFVNEPDIVLRENLQEFHEAITGFLGLAGHRIIVFQYRFFAETAGEIYDCIRRWAGLMPSLEHLWLDRSFDIDVGVAPALESIQQFPSLPMLRCYEEGWKVLPVPYVHRIMEACPGIRDLGLTELQHVREHSSELLESLVDLTSLRICPNDSLMQNIHLPWKLNKLILYRMDPKIFGFGYSYTTEVSSDLLFKFLKQFEDTLEHLEFEMVMVTTPTDGFLELKNLRTLVIKLDQSFDNLNFLLYAKKLESLRVFIGNVPIQLVDVPLPHEKIEGIIRNSFLGMKISDIFPSLKRFVTSIEVINLNIITKVVIEEVRVFPQ